MLNSYKIEANYNPPEYFKQNILIKNGSRNPSLMSQSYKQYSPLIS